MDIRPVLTALKRQKLAAALIALQITLVCAIVSNALFMIAERIERASLDSGVAESELVRIKTASLADGENRTARAAEDLAALRALPGIREVAATQQVPFGRQSWNSGLTTDPGQVNDLARAAIYHDGGNFIPTMGIRLLEGRDFAAAEYVDNDKASVAIVTRPLAEKLWPQESALGRTLYKGDQPMRIIGVVDTLVRPSIEGPDTASDSLILPLRDSALRSGQFVLRVQPEQRDQVLAAARDELRRLQPNRLILNADTLSGLRDDYFRQDNVMARLLTIVVAALLTVTAVGIVGLASFWVQQRRRHIGIRRALGATRRQTLHYFQIENFLIVTAGVIVGMFAAYGINALLMSHYELPRLPLVYLPLSAVVMWALGQFAVLPPAINAMRVSPAEAVRAN